MTEEQILKITTLLNEIMSVIKKEERKPVIKFEGHVYRDGDFAYWFNKRLDIVDKTLLKGPPRFSFSETEVASKMYPTEALRDSALEAYKLEKECPFKVGEWIAVRDCNRYYWSVAQFVKTQDSRYLCKNEMPECLHVTWTFAKKLTEFNK